MAGTSESIDQRITNKTFEPNVQADGEEPAPLDEGRASLPMTPDRSRAERLHRQGLAHRRAGNSKMAIAAFQDAIAIDGYQAKFYKDLGNAYSDVQKWDLSLKCFRTSLRLAPASAEAWYDMGCAMQTRGMFEDARNCYRNVLKLHPRHPDSLNNLGLIMAATGQIDEALACYRRAVQINPTHYIAINNLGNTFRQKGNTDNAMACYDRAISVNPEIADAHHNKGSVLWEMGLHAKSLESFALAHRLAPESQPILFNYANVLLSQGRPRRALSCYHRLIADNPNNKQVIVNMGLCHEALGAPSSAAACYRRALNIDTDYSKAQSLLVSLLKRTCQWDDLPSASESLDRLTAIALKNGEKPEETPFQNISRHTDSHLNYRVARAWSKPIEERYHPDSGNCRRSLKSHQPSHGRLTIGYLSCNFRNHPTAQLMAGLLGQHDRSRFKVMCYSYGIDDGSLYREEIKKNCDQFIDLRGVGDINAAGRIRSDGVNILIDLGGFTKDNRLGIAAQRPAPLQVRYLGLAGTTGASFFDYLITDKIVTPPELAEYYSERLLYMPYCYQVNNYKEISIDDSVQRADYGLPCEGHVFCAFHAAYKMDLTIYSAWMRILKAVPNAVLWLSIPEPLAQAQLKKYALQHGIDIHRLIFAESLPKDEHLRRMRLSNTALDTIQVTGAATTSDALWAELPVVTMIGQHFASRMSASILSTIGLPQLITTSLKQYEALAIQLAMDSNFYQATRNALRNVRKRSPLFDTKCFTTCLETGFEMIWGRYLKGHQPSMLEIPILSA